MPINKEISDTLKPDTELFFGEDLEPKTSIIQNESNSKNISHRRVESLNSQDSSLIQVNSCESLFLDLTRDPNNNFVNPSRQVQLSNLTLSAKASPQADLLLEGHLEMSSIQSPLPNNYSLDSEGPICTPSHSNNNSVVIYPTIRNILNTPVRPKKAFATCISSADRSPYRGPPGSLTRSPTIQLGNKIFHVPGSILLGGPEVSPKQTKKKQVGIYVVFKCLYLFLVRVILF